MKVLNILFVLSLSFNLSFTTKMKSEVNGAWINTPVTDVGLFETGYLNRQPVYCPNGQVLQSFRLMNHNNQKLNYVYKCKGGSSVGTTSKNLSTVWSPMPTSLCLYNLERLNVQCPSGHGLNGFYLFVNGGLTGGQMRYDFKCAPIQTQCCKTQTTAPTVASQWHTIYLERQIVGNEGPRNDRVLTGFKLIALTNLNPREQIKYQYNYCILKDQAAINRVNNARNAFNTAKAAFNYAKQTNDRIQNQLKNLQNTISARTALRKKQKANHKKLLAERTNVEARLDALEKQGQNAANNQTLQINIDNQKDALNNQLDKTNERIQMLDDELDGLAKVIKMYQGRVTKLQAEATTARNRENSAGTAKNNAKTALQRAEADPLYKSPEC